MADRKISDLTALTTPASGDFLPIVDISEAAAASKNKRITIEELMRGMPDGTAAAPSIAFESDPNTGIYRPGADQVAISTNGTARLYVGSTGSVGIGTTSPSTLLDLQSASPTLRLAPTTQNNSSSIELGVLNGGVNAYAKIDATNSATYDTNIRFWTNASGSTTQLERARIDNSGRLLVGTSSARSNFFNTTTFAPAFQLESTSSDGRLASIVLNEDSASSGWLLFGKTRGTSNGANTVVSNGDSLGNVSFQGADGSELVEAARISAEVDGTPGANDMPGRLVFSTTADGAASPTERMRITSTGWSQHVAVDHAQTLSSSTGAGTTFFFIAGKHSATLGSADSGTMSFRVWTNGNVENTSNSYGAISDVKLKENIVNAGSQWSDLKALQVRKYNLKEGQTHTQIGLVAQEAELISPGLVYESPDRDAEGNDLGTVTKSVNYSVLYMKAVKALQEAMERIESLEAKVAALESA
jgi:hypothetical protein